MTKAVAMLLVLITSISCSFAQTVSFAQQQDLQGVLNWLSITVWDKDIALNQTALTEFDVEGDEDVMRVFMTVLGEDYQLVGFQDALGVDVDLVFIPFLIDAGYGIEADYFVPEPSLFLANPGAYDNKITRLVILKR